MNADAEEPHVPGEPEEAPAEQPPGPRPDVDAQFADIVAHLGEIQVPPAPERPGLSDRFRSRGWSEPILDTRGPGRHAADAGDSLNTGATWEDEGHFVPPDPPPVAVPEPRRMAAWMGVFGAPLVMLLLSVMDVSLPAELTFFVIVGFVGGFIYLVATMDRERGGWPGDDGAVL